MDSGKLSGLRLVVAEKSATHSEYDWINIYHDDQFVGKIRGKIQREKFTIYTITIFTEFQDHGYGKKVIERIQEDYALIIADRVRYSAVGFWEKMNFKPRPDGCFEFRQEN